MVKKKKPTHLVVRFSDTLFGIGDVVSRHNEIVDKYGSVYFGKMGQPISQLKVDQFNKQIEKKIPTSLYLVKGNRRKSTAYHAPLLFITRAMPKEDFLIPSYYSEKEILQFMKVFMKVGRIEGFDMEDMSSLQTISSLYPITETLVLSSTGHFFVQKKSPE